MLNEQAKASQVSSKAFFVLIIGWHLDLDQNILEK